CCSCPRASRACCASGWRAGRRGWHERLRAAAPKESLRPARRDRPQAEGAPVSDGMVLRIEGVTQRFGGLVAVRDVNLALARGEIIGLIGPNGAGKTTLFNAVSGFFRPSEGRIVFDGRDVTGTAPHVLARLGLVRTFQGARVFPKLTVEEGLRTAAHLPSGRGAARQPVIANAMAELGLERYRHELAGSLPSG